MRVNGEKAQRHKGKDCRGRGMPRPSGPRYPASATVSLLPTPDSFLLHSFTHTNLRSTDLLFLLRSRLSVQPDTARNRLWIVHATGQQRGICGVFRTNLKIIRVFPPVGPPTYLPHVVLSGVRPEQMYRTTHEERGCIVSYGAKKTFAAIVLCCSLLSTPALPAFAAPPEEAVRHALAEFSAARKGNEGAVKRTLSRLRALSRDEGETSAMLAFVGSLTAMKARHTSLVWKKLSLAKDGARMLDRAVEQSPHDATVRLVRAGTYINFPSMMNKDEHLREDVDFIETAYRNGNISEDQQDEALRVLVRYCHKAGDTDRCRQFFAQVKDHEIREELAALIPGDE